MLTENTDINSNANKILTDDDFVFNNKNGTLIGGNYTINSILLQNGQNPISTETLYSHYGGINDNNDEPNDLNELDGGKKSYTNKYTYDFDKLGIPGIFLVTNNKNKIDTENSEKIEYKNHKMLNDDLFEQLLLYKGHSKKQTRRNKKNTHSKTKKK
jgi:hypothetical protein